MKKPWVIVQSRLQSGTIEFFYTGVDVLHIGQLNERKE